jgi:hypothetical protein
MLNRWARGYDAGVRVVPFSALHEEGYRPDPGPGAGSVRPGPSSRTPGRIYSVFGRTDGSAGDFEEGILTAEIAFVGTS